jgi:hypothetical protein
MTFIRSTCELFEGKHIILNKKDYVAGETVNGTIKSGTKIRNAKSISLFAYGKESTKIVVPRRKQSNSVYTSKNEFFFTDLSSMLQTDENTPFSFKIPPNVLSSYKGKRASVSYGIHLNAKVQMGFDVKDEVTFAVFDPKNMVPTKNKPVEAHDKKNMLTVILENDVYPTGSTIRGEAIINDKVKNKVKKIKATLRGFEDAVAGRRKRTRMIDEKTFDLGMPGQGFTIKLPFDLQRSYAGKYSKFYWTVDVGLDIPFRLDIHVPLEVAIL